MGSNPQIGSASTNYYQNWTIYRRSYELTLIGLWQRNSGWILQKSPAEAEFFDCQYQSYDFHTKSSLFDRIVLAKVKNLRDGVKSSQKTSHKICHIQGPPLGMHTGALNLTTFSCESLSLLTPSWLTAVSTERCSLPDLWAEIWPFFWEILPKMSKKTRIKWTKGRRLKIWAQTAVR